MSKLANDNHLFDHKMPFGYLMKVTTNFRLGDRMSLTIRVLREFIHCFSGFINTELWSEKPTGGRISGTL